MAIMAVVTRSNNKHRHSTSCTTNNVSLAIAFEAVKSLEHCAPTTAAELTLQAVVHSSPARARGERGVALAHVLCWGTILDTSCSPHTCEELLGKMKLQHTPDTATPSCPSLLVGKQYGAHVCGASLNFMRG